MVEHFSLSGDGGTLFYSSNQVDIHGRHIFRVAAAGAGGKPVPLTKGATIGCYPVALASGKDVAFLSATAKQPMSVAVVPAAGGRPRSSLPARFRKNSPWTT
jgi:Tol biopolymer transport system component